MVEGATKKAVGAWRRQLGSTLPADAIGSSSLVAHGARREASGSTRAQQCTINEKPSRLRLFEATTPVLFCARGMQ
jgi:hypothetical protein